MGGWVRGREGGREGGEQEGSLRCRRRQLGVTGTCPIPYNMFNSLLWQQAAVPRAAAPGTAPLTSVDLP